MVLLRPWCCCLQRLVAAITLDHVVMAPLLDLVAVCTVDLLQVAPLHLPFSCAAHARAEE
jgi:hypothetical protein